MSRSEELTLFKDNVERINVKDDMVCQEFIDRFEKLYKPVMIEGAQVDYWWLLIT